MRYFFEVIIASAALIAVTRILYVSQYSNAFVGKYYATIFAVIFLYVPLAIMRWRKRSLDFIDGSLGEFFNGVTTFFVVAAIVFPPYLIGAHFWELWVYGSKGFHFAMYPDLWKTAIFQILLVALPEEFFFRGYMQGTLDKTFKKRWNIFGARLGLAWPVTAMIFAFSHSFIHFQWWHFSIFFPALLFGWLREKTGSITAPILFHATANVIAAWINVCYF